MKKPKRKNRKGGAAVRSSELVRRRPPCALMSVSTCTEADCAALRKLTDAGMEVVVVQDKDFESALKLIEKVRWSTPSNDQAQRLAANNPNA